MTPMALLKTTETAVCPDCHLTIRTAGMRVVERQITRRISDESHMAFSDTIPIAHTLIEEAADEATLTGGSS